MKLSPKHVFGGMMISAVLLIAGFLSLPDGKLHLIFCNVGQGDAALIMTPRGQQILIDGGPNEKVLDCLGRHMPFWDRTVELVLLSHPQTDHGNGLVSVLERYGTRYFVGDIGETKVFPPKADQPLAEGEKSSKVQGFKIVNRLAELKNLLVKEKINRKTVGAGEKIGIDGVEIEVLWPEKETVRDLGEVEGLRGDEINENSLVLEIKFGGFKALLTADTTKEILGDLGDLSNLGNLDVLKVPHHGSKFGLSEEILEWLRPKLAVISVGKNNYGHPAEETLKLLKGFGGIGGFEGVKVLRTDLDGEIEIVSDGKTWEVK